MSQEQHQQKREQANPSLPSNQLGQGDGGVDPLRERKLAFKFEFNDSDLNKEPQTALFRQKDQKVVPILFDDDDECDG